MSTFGERLRAARTEMRMNQDEFAALASVSRRAQVNYESSDRMPEAGYLTALLAHGIDVPYLITGSETPDDVLDNMRIAAQITETAVMADEQRSVLRDKLKDMAVADTKGHYSVARRLRKDQVALLDAYEHCSPDARSAALKLLSSAAQHNQQTGDRHE